MSFFHALFPHWLDWLYRVIDWPMSTGRDGAYNLWSGIGIGILFPLVYIRRHNCHMRWCPFIQFHEHPDHARPVCRFHYKRPHRGTPMTATTEGTG